MLNIASNCLQLLWIFLSHSSCTYLPWNMLKISLMILKMTRQKEHILNEILCIVIKTSVCFLGFTIYIVVGVISIYCRNVFQFDYCLELYIKYVNFIVRQNQKARFKVTNMARITSIFKLTNTNFTKCINMYIQIWNYFHPLPAYIILISENGTNVW